LMFAALRKLPAIFICENNGLATNTDIKYRQPSVPIFKRAEGFGVKAIQVDGNNALEVFKAMGDAVQLARSGGGPTFIEAITYRILEHCGPNSDVSLGFRTQEEVDGWKKRDPILFLENQVDPKLKSNFESEIQNEIDHAFAEAKSAPFPSRLVPEGYACL
jgi:TPP-dependent pyruvate/acetoin dehydrogenase alpha subunit